jgi:hypothetical protein
LRLQTIATCKLARYDLLELTFGEQAWIVSMEKMSCRIRTIFVVAAMTAVGGLPLAAQTYRAPRGPDGKPDLNGIWQALNEANYDLEAHAARPAMALRPGPYGAVPAAATLALGAVGAVPPSLGVVEGGEIPYRSEGIETRKQNQQDWLNRDPEIKWLFAIRCG